MKIQIADKLVGQDQPCFIIAEAASNHDGKLKQAKELIDIAKEAKADAVKFQTFSAEKLYSRKTPMMEYLQKNKLIGKGKSVWHLSKEIAMPREWLRSLADYCKENKIIFLSTPFDLEAIDKLEEFVPAYKISSFEIAHLPLLQHIATKKKPIILSTGMANLTDIELALGTLYKQGLKEIILLHCAIGYPADYKNLNLKALRTIQQAFQLPVGFSDHTLGITASIAAVTLGACVIEKHFTISRKLCGPDHPFALEPGELMSLVQAIRDTEVSLGSPIKRCGTAEMEMYKLGRRSLVAIRDIPEGTIITGTMLDVKRPGFGIHPKMQDLIIGRIAKIDIKNDDILTWEMV